MTAAEKKNLTTGRKHAMKAMSTKNWRSGLLGTVLCVVGLVSALLAGSAGAAVYKSTGSFGSSPSYMDIKQSTGTVYTTNGGDTIAAFDATGAPLANFLVDSGASLSQVALDNTGGPNNGLLYVKHSGDQLAKIEAFDASGNLVGTPFSPGSGVFWPMASGSTGNLYIPQQLTQEPNTVQVFTPDGTLLQALRCFECAAPGLFGDITGVTVDSKGNLYVSGRKATRSERQSVKIDATGGTYSLGFDGKNTGGAGTGDLQGPATGSGDTSTATGTGDLSVSTGTGDRSILSTGKGDRSVLATGTGQRSLGSVSVLGFSTTSGTFNVGQSISGQGIAPGTTIAAIRGPILTLSKPATAATTENTALTSGSKTITNFSTTTGSFNVGDSLSGTGIVAGTTITAIEGSTVTLSIGVNAAGTGGTLNSGSKTITNFSTTTGSFSVGDSLSGTGIAPGTSITAIEAGTLTLSLGVTSAGTAGSLTAGSKTVTNVNTLSGAFAVGQDISGTSGVSAGTTITAVGPGTLTLSNGATSAAPGVNLTAGSRLVSNLSTFTGSFAVGQEISASIPDVLIARIVAVEPGGLLLDQPAKGAATGVGLQAKGRIITNVAPTTGAFAPGEVITGPGLEPGTKIEKVTSNSLTVTPAPTASANGATLSANLSFDATSANVSEALSSLSTIGKGNIAVTGTPLNGLTIDFQGGLSGKDVPQISANASGLTGGGAKVDVETLVPGGPIPARVIKYDSDGKTATSLIAGETAGATVNRTNDSVLIAHDNGPGTETHIVGYDSSGNQFADFGLGSIGGGERVPLAVNWSTGAVYVGDAANNKIWIFAPVLPTSTTGAAGSVTQTGASLNGTINPNEGGAIVGCYFQWGTTTDYSGGTVPCASKPGDGNAAVPVSGAISGLTANTTYHFRLVSDNGATAVKGADQTFKTSPNAPVVTTGTTAGITKTSASLTGSVNANGGATTCSFEYGTTEAYGQSVPCTANPGSGTTPKAVSASLTGLAAGTTYHYRLKATNSGGTSEGGDKTFTTVSNPPVAATEAASGVAQRTATLNAKVDAEGDTSSCRFEYGTSASYGQSIDCSPNPVTGSDQNAVSAALAGLEPGTTYHFRVVAKNKGGETQGADLTFMTLAHTCETNAALCPAPPPAVTPPPVTPPATTPPPSGAKPLKCKKGFKKKKIKGKAKCVKVKKRKRKRR